VRAALQARQRCRASADQLSGEDKSCRDPGERRLLGVADALAAKIQKGFFRRGPLSYRGLAFCFEILR
jgi:hypothetical protein